MFIKSVQNVLETVIIRLTFVFLFVIFFIFKANSQTHNIPKTTNDTWTSCSGILYDHAGTGDYGNNANGYTVIYPSTVGNAVQLTGTYNTETNWDFVYIYNGVGTGGTLLGQYSGSGTIPTFTSSHLSGALTVRFTSDATVASSGISLNVACVTPCTGTPNAGTTSISVSSGCANNSFTLSAVGVSVNSGIVYQWQTSPNGTSGWSNISGATNASLVTSTAVNSFYRLMSTCSNSSLYNYSNVVSYTIENCIPATSNNSITSCSGSLYDNGGSLLNYSENIDGYTTIYPSVAGNKIQIDGTYSSESGYDYLYIYNGVGTGGTLLGQYSGSSSIPRFTSTDATGAITVRFSSDGSVNTSGVNLNYNCVTSCSGAPTPGNTISATTQACSGVNFNLSLQNSLLFSGLTYQWQLSTNGTVYSNISGAVNSTCSVNQSVATYYRCLVTCSNSGLSNYSNPVFVSMSSICYCIPTTSNINASDIVSKVSITNSIFNNVNQVSGYNATTSYDLYYSPVIDIQRGSSTNKLSITFGSDPNQWSAAWIDFNQNGTFESSENVALAASSSGSSSTVVYTFSVPVSATLGQTRLRVRGASDNAYTSSDACTTTSYGETEDYIVNILPVYSLAISGPTTSCSSTDVQYVAGVHNFPGTPTYQWYYNSNMMAASGGANTPYYSSFSGGTSQTLNVNTGTSSPILWSCVATYNGWTATSNTISLIVSGTPSVAPTGITVLNNNTCQGTSKTLSVNGGSIGTGGSWNWYTGSCGGSSVGTGSSIVVNPSITTTYYVRAEGTCNTTSCFSVSVVVTPPPSNDLCANATSISTFPYNSGVVSNNCATSDAPPTGASSCGAHDYNVWYKFTGTGNQMMISTCDGATNFDTEIHIYTGSCGSMTEVVCSDDGIDAGCSAGQSSLTLCTTNGIVYYISVGSYQLSGSTGSYRLNVSEKLITAATISANSVCGDGAVTLTASIGANSDAVDFSIDGGATVAGSDNTLPYQYTTTSLTAPSSLTVHVRSRNSNGCVGQWVNSVIANAYSLPTLTFNTLCNYEGMARVELVPAGGSNSYTSFEQQSPNTSQSTNRFSLPYSTSRSFKVVDSHTCSSNWQSYNSIAAPSQIANAATSGNCIIRGDNSWWHIADGSNRVILSVNDNGNDLGDIVATSYLESTTSQYGQSYYLKRHFKVSSQKTPITNVTVRFYYTQDELDELILKSNSNTNSNDDVNSASDLRITRYSGPNEDGDYSNNNFTCSGCFSVFTPAIGSPVTPNLGSDVRYVEISVPGFSEQWIHGGQDNVSILPVELVSFMPTCLNNQVLIHWVTASEANNSHFLLQKSTNGIDFSTIANINGSGNSNSFIEYSYIDKTISSELSYYRLIQVDYNGTQQVFDPKSVTCNDKNESLTVFPNPFTDKVYVSGLPNNLCAFEIINAFGQSVYKLTSESKSSVELDLSPLPTGMYMIKIIDANGICKQISIIKK